MLRVLSGGVSHEIPDFMQKTNNYDGISAISIGEGLGFGQRKSLQRKRLEHCKLLVSSFCSFSYRIELYITARLVTYKLCLFGVRLRQVYLSTFHP